MHLFVRFVNVHHTICATAAAVDCPGTAAAAVEGHHVRPELSIEIAMIACSKYTASGQQRNNHKYAAELACIEQHGVCKLISAAITCVTICTTRAVDLGELLSRTGWA